MEGAQFLEDAQREYRRNKALAEKAIAQVTDEQFFRMPDPESNSVALVVKHLAGNLRSRWTDFLTTDGEKPDRHRDSEFVPGDKDARDTLLARWEEGWQAVLGTLSSLKPGDLDRSITIRGEPMTVPQAITRGLTHAAYHVGQIVYLAKHWVGAKWTSLSIPRGRSEDTRTSGGGYLKS